MSKFPGRIYSGDGVPMDGRRGDLTQEQISDYPHRSMVVREDVAPVAWVWLVNDDASFSSVPTGVLDGAIKLVMGGQSILILSRLPTPGAEIRDGLLGALDLAQVPDDVAGHA